MNLENGLMLAETNSSPFRRLPNGNRLSSTYSCANKLIPNLVDFDQHQKRLEFDRQLVNCEICLSPKVGEVCSRLTCGHVFCKSCLTEYFSLLTEEGSVLDIKCPSCGLAVPPNCVKESLTPELFDRYERYC